MDQEHRSDRFTAIEDQYAGYTVYDQTDQKIGKVDDLFVNENDQRGELTPGDSGRNRQGYGQERSGL
jgi:rRNA processing protein Gar1